MSLLDINNSMDIEDASVSNNDLKLIDNKSKGSKRNKRTLSAWSPIDSSKEKSGIILSNNINVNSTDSLYKKIDRTCNLTV